MDMEELFQLRMTADKGYGLVATQDIKAGTRIIAEKPLIHLPPGNEDVDIIKILDELTLEQRIQCAGLASHESTLLASRRKKFIRAELEISHQGVALEAAVHDIANMLAIYYCNRVEMGSESLYGDGVFPIYSRVNHSCRPNIVNKWNPTIGLQTIHALRDIKTGEELTTAYSQCYDTQKQEIILHTNWGFVCRCEVCEGDEAEASKERRDSLLCNDERLAAYKEKRYDAEGCPQNDAEALKLAEEQVGLIKEEGLVDPLLIGYHDCCDHAANLGFLAKAMAYAKKVLEIERICMGDETNHLGEEGAKYLVAFVDGLMKNEAAKERMREEEAAKERTRQEAAKELMRDEAEKEPTKEDAVKERMNGKREAKQQKKADKKAAKKATQAKK